MTTLNTIIEEEKEKAVKEIEEIGHLHSPECMVWAEEDCDCGMWGIREEAQKLLASAMQRAYEAGEREERAKIEEAFASKSKYIEDFVPNEYGTEIISTSHYLIYEGDWEKVISPSSQRYEVN